MKTAADVMSCDKLVLLKETQPTYFAFLYMDEHNIRHIPVVNTEGEIQGMISDRDLKKRISDAFDPEDMSFDDLAFMMREARQVMNPDPLFAYPDTPLLTVVQMMLTHKTSSIIIVPADSYRPVGIVTSTDLLHVLSAQLQAEH